MEVSPTRAQMWRLIYFPPRVTTQKFIYLWHTEYLSPHKQYHPHENPQTTYTSYMRIHKQHTLYLRFHKHTPYLRIEVIHIIDKYSHIFFIHMTSHPHRLIEVIHIVSYLYTYTIWNRTHTKTYASHGHARLLELCPLPSGVSLKSTLTNEFPDPPSCSPGAPIVVGGVWYYTLIWFTKV
jgi:hypothetical protein